jgi:hypothetical protein
VVFAASTPEVIEVVKLCAEAARGGDPLQHEHLARRADQCAVRRHLARSLAYEPHPPCIRLHGIPQTILSAVCPLATIEGACNATIVAMQMGLPLARIELADAVQIRAIGRPVAFAPEPKSSPPMSACLSRRSLLALAKAALTSSAPACLHRL